MGGLGPENNLAFIQRDSLCSSVSLAPFLWVKFNFALMNLHILI